MKLRIYSRANSHEVPIKEWKALAARSVVSNPFYEHWNLLPALEHLEVSSDVELVTAWRNDKLVALFPVCYSHRSFIFTLASIWKHEECYCTSPLLANKKVWTEVLEKLRQKRRINMLISTTQTRRALLPNKQLHLTMCTYERAVLDSTQSFKQMSEFWPRKRRRDWQRLIRKTLIQKKAQYHTKHSSEDCLAAFEAYKQIESKGWKGRGGSALKLNPASDKYYQAVIEQGCESQQVELQVLQLKSKVIAASMRLITGEQAFEVKTSFCENHRDLAPGVLLEILNMEQLAESNIKLADSCTQAGNRMLETLWGGRIEIYNSIYFGSDFISKLAWRITRRYKTRKHQLDKQCFKNEADAKKNNQATLSGSYARN